MDVEKKDLIDVLNSSIKALQQDIDAHCRIVTSIVEERLDVHNLQSLLDLCPKRAREFKLEKAIIEAIETIEETKKAFKSKRLEALRKRLIQALVDEE